MFKISCLFTLTSYKNLTLFIDWHEELKDVVENDDVASSHDIRLVHDVAANHRRHHIGTATQIFLQDSTLKIAKIRVQFDSDDGGEGRREERSAQEKGAETRADVEKVERRGR